ncbi:ArsR family transcriptional regulator [Clostridium sp. 19966]|uniref:ArsR family transcriptional regulator n=1 Tax=Clostridium sp. 19966 TaxID=2768166 RepID=UPI0028DF92D7|nr:ArsR family transcriptional regulator [Clostridium sp. 19966]MDT8719682.1 ArsR family transcriptional regulator [Clostridium sp. 19966]
MEQIDDLIKRIEKLESAVFGKNAIEKQGTVLPLSDNFNNIVKEVNENLKSLKVHFKDEDSIIFQSVFHNKDAANDYQLTSLFVLDEEEPDEEIEALCNVLSSKQRICILRYLTRNQYSSGELVELTKMAGGHLHHHLKELLLNKFICKNENGKYTATNQGLNVYLTIAALNRRLKYDDRID